ncbi:hypothetical protein GCM10028828_05130 [Corynebacterium tapiri]
MLTEVTEDGAGLALIANTDASVNSYMWFVVLTGLLGVAVGSLAVAATRTRPSTRGVLWSGLCAVTGALAFFLVGDAVSHALHTIPDLPTVQPGQQVELVTDLDPTVALIAAPLMATMAHWCGLVMRQWQEI